MGQRGRGGEGEGYTAHIHYHCCCSMAMPCAHSLPQNYDGDVSDLCLTFSWDEDFMGKVRARVWGGGGGGCVGG